MRSYCAYTRLLPVDIAVVAHCVLERLQQIAHVFARKNPNQRDPPDLARLLGKNCTRCGERACAKREDDLPARDYPITWVAFN